MVVGVGEGTPAQLGGNCERLEDIDLRLQLDPLHDDVAGLLTVSEIVTTACSSEPAW